MDVCLCDSCGERIRTKHQAIAVNLTAGLENGLPVVQLTADYCFTCVQNGRVVENLSARLDQVRETLAGMKVRKR